MHFVNALILENYWACYSEKQKGVLLKIYNVRRINHASCINCFIKNEWKKTAC